MPKRVIKGTTESHHKLRETHGCQKSNIDDFFESKEKREKRELREFVEGLRIFEIDHFDFAEVCEYCNIDELDECEIPDQQKINCKYVLEAKKYHKLRDFYTFDIYDEEHPIVYMDCCKIMCITTLTGFSSIENRLKIHSLDELYFLIDGDTFTVRDRYFGHKSFPGNYFRYTLIRGFLRNAKSFEINILYYTSCNNILMEIVRDNKFKIYIAPRIPIYD